MNKDIKQYLIKAIELKTVGKNKEALKFFKKAYDEDPEAFTTKKKIDFAWTIYRVEIQNYKSEEELLKAVEFITQLLDQRDLNTHPNCVYTSSVFKVLTHFKDEKDYIIMIPWLERLDADLLDEKPYRNYGRIQKSKKEKYYDWASKAYLDDMQFEKCIEVSETALDTFTTFLQEGDVWYRYRIAKSLMELNRYNEALKYYLKVIEIKHDWYMYRDIAEIYCCYANYNEALKYLCPAVLSNESNQTKASIYYTCFKVFSLFNPDMALKHAQLYCILQNEKGYSLPYDIERLEIDESNLNKRELEREIRTLWTRYKYKDQKLHYGTVTKFIPEKNYGFIKTENDEEVFFHKNEFKDKTVYVGQKVSFYTEKSFDKVKNQKSVKAVNVRGE